MIDSSRMVRAYHEEQEKDKTCPICHQVFTHVKRRGMRKHPYCASCYTRFWREYRLSTHYGLSLGDYLNMVSEQDGKCAICGESPDKLVVDHCHDTGVVRGLLCPTCNSGLGMFHDRLKTVLAAARYLRERGDYVE